MFPRLFVAMLMFATALCSIVWSSAEAATKAEKAVQAYAELFAFGKTDNASAIGLTKAQLRDLEMNFDNGIAMMFKEYPLSEDTLATVKAKYVEKLKAEMNIRAKLSTKDDEHPIVTLTANAVDRQTIIVRSVGQNKDLLTMAVMKRFKQNDGVSAAALRSDEEFQQVALTSIERFIDQIPMHEQSIDVRCELVESEGKFYYVPSDLQSLKAFVDPMFEIKSADDSTIDSFVEAIFAPSGTHEIKKPEPEKPSVERDEDKHSSNDKWLIYWYVCGTDIETNRILFSPQTNFDTNQILLQNELEPGDATLCIREVEAADLSSDKVKVLMQAGGTTIWGHEKFHDNNAKLRLYKGVAYKFKDGLKLRKRFDGYKPGDQMGENAFGIERNGKISRYVYGINERDWKPRQQFSFDANDPRTQMGASEALKDFLRYGKEVIEPELKPDHRVFIFVDHGAGSLFGVCFDQNLEKGRNLTHAQTFEYSLKLKGIRDAFKEVWGVSDNNPPFEMIAFDACNMATYETALALEGITRYMAASQETMWGKVMFEYTGLLSRLSADPGMTGAELGKVLCDTYEQDAENSGLKYNTNYSTDLTFSVIDMSRMPALETAYDNFATEAKNYAMSLNRPYSFVRNFAVNADKTKTAVFANGMVDLKNIVENTKAFSTSPHLKRTCDELMSALGEAIIENRTNAMYSEADGRTPKIGGLSTYYEPSFNMFNMFESLSDNNLASKAQRDLYREMIKAKEAPRPTSVAQTSEQGTNTANHSPIAGTIFDLSDLNETYVNVYEDDLEVVVDLKQNDLDRISSVRGQLIKVQSVRDVDGQNKMKMLFLGGDTNIESDWEIGEFKSKFNGKWITIEGQPVFVQIISESTSVDAQGNKIGSEFYSVPILLNDSMCNLLISCSYPNETFKVIGAIPDQTASGQNTVIPSREMYGISKGDVINPIFLAMNVPFNIDDNSELAKRLAPEKNRDIESKVTTVEYLLKNDYGTVYKGAPITVGHKLSIGRGILPDGNYAYVFEFVNPMGGANAYSETNTIFNIKNGKITLRQVDDIENPDELKD